MYFYIIQSYTLTVSVSLWLNKVLQDQTQRIFQDPYPH